MFVGCLALINGRVSEHHVPQDEHTTGHAAPRLFIHLCTEARRVGRRGGGTEAGGLKEQLIRGLRCSRTCDELAVDAPGDGRCGDAFSLTVQADSFPWRVQLAGWLLHPVGGR